MWRKGEMTEKLDEEMEEQSSGAGEDEVIAFVGHGVEFKGVITYDGTVRIDGRLEGEIHTEGVLVVGEAAVITAQVTDRKSTRLNSSHGYISYAVFCLKKKKKNKDDV